MIQLMMVQSDKTVDLSDLVVGVEWSGSKSKAPRSISVKLLHTDRGNHEKAEVANGNGILLRLGEEELFRGIVFKADYGSDELSITAYDQLIYLTNNKDSYLFTSSKASAIMAKLCTDFSIPAGSIADTRHVLPYLVCDGETLYDMIMKALDATFKHTGERFALFSRKGKVELAPVKGSSQAWVIENGVNLIDYSFSQSIEGTATKVKLVAGEEKQTIIATAENKSLQKQFGVLQRFEHVKEKLNRAQLQERANQILAKEGKEQMSFQLNNLLGIPEVITGTSVHVRIPELGIERVYAVEEDKHSFTGRKHMMSLTLKEI